jgi:translation initiation factor 3 subunit B
MTEVLPAVNSIIDELAAEAEELDGYFSDTPLDLDVKYPPLDENFATSVIITNLPKVPEAKIEKLSKVVLKLVSKIGPLQATEGGFQGYLMPLDDSGNTLGFCFVEYETLDSAKACVDVLNDYKLDKNHSLTVTMYSRTKQLQTIDTTSFQEPTIIPFVEKPNAASWLEDENQRDQFVIRYAKETAVLWFDGRNDPAVDYNGSREKEAGVAWCDYYCHFSPMGSHLATLVPPRGVILWSGKDYEKSGRFPARKCLVIPSVNGCHKPNSHNPHFL